MIYKFIHMADIHWRGLSRHDEYRASFEDAFEKIRKISPDAIFIVGDIVHSKTQGISPELISNLTWWFRELDSIASTYITLGNHDGLISNLDREDAISPIVRALNLNRTTLIKGSKKIKFNSEIDISNFCPFDQESWNNISPTPDKMNLALFHGAVGGSFSDEGWKLESDININFFDGYDFVMLGDIHKRQTLDSNNRILYCGSTIQQNYGETPDKGFTVWEIESKDTFVHKHILVKHTSPFVTIDWKGNISDLQDESSYFDNGSRFRIRSNENINQTDIKKIHSFLKEKKEASEIVFKNESKIDNVKNDIDLINKDLSLKDSKSISEMIVDFHRNLNLSSDIKNRILEQSISFCNRIEKIDGKTNCFWSIKKLEFDNTFGYGKDNVINFDNLEGITGIFGQNRVGKSSICGTLMYSLFNTTDRGSMPNLHVVNTRKGYCSTNLTFGKNGKLYKIERQTTKKENKKGEVHGVTNLNLFEVDSYGNLINDLCDEQRRETDKVLKELIGTSDDFLLTSFAAQGEMNSFIEQKATVRKNILTRFLELDIFEQINDMAKNDSQGLRQLIKNSPNRDYDSLIKSELELIETLISKREILKNELEIAQDNIRITELNLATNNEKDKYTPNELQDQEFKLAKIFEDIEKDKNKIYLTEKELEEIEIKILKIEDLRINFPIDNLKNSLKDFRDLQYQINNINHESEKEKQKQKTLSKQVKILDDVPCGDEYLTCPFIVDAHKAKQALKFTNTRLDEIEKDLLELKQKFKKDSIKDLEEKIDRYDDFLKKQSDYKVQKSRLELKKSELISGLEKLNSFARAIDLKINEMKSNLSTDSTAQQLEKIRKELQNLKTNEKNIQNELISISEKIGLSQSNVEILKTEQEKMKEATEQFLVYDYIAQATSKNGIPLNIIRQRLPLINSEISSILQNVAGFTVELESLDGSSDMDIYINYGDSKRIIECSSGMEKMMASLAIRVALSNVSQLPKSDVFIIDEGFGALDASNIEACNRFLESLKKWFRCILIISHIDAIKDSVDNVLEISRINGDAFVKQN